jgi:transcriptional regulator with XRE-family HTH domain
VSNIPEPWFQRSKVKTAVQHWAVESGVRLSQRRQELGFSRKLLAEITGTTEATVSRLESGQLTPRDDLRWICAGVLQCAVEDIWPYPTREQIVRLRGAA